MAIIGSTVLNKPLHFQTTSSQISSLFSDVLLLHLVCAFQQALYVFLSDSSPFERFRPFTGRGGSGGNFLTPLLHSTSTTINVCCCLAEPQLSLTSLPATALLPRIFQCLVPFLNLINTRTLIQLSRLQITLHGSYKHKHNRSIKETIYMPLQFKINDELGQTSSPFSIP